MYNHKKLCLMSTLLLATSLSTPANAACPAASAGTITVGGASTGCVLNTADHTLVVNSGGTIIDGASAGVYLTSDTVTSITNSGLIDGVNGAVFIDGSATITSITNNVGATMRSYDTLMSGESAIRLESGSSVTTITNWGTIDGYADGIRLLASNAGSIVNETGANIYGNSSGIYVDDSTAGSITNKGYIQAENYLGIHVSNSAISGSITNDVDGVIESLNYGSGIQLDSGSTLGGNIVNNGTIYGRNASGGSTNAGIKIEDAQITGDIINNGLMEMSGLAGYDNVRGIDIAGATSSVRSIINEEDATINMRLNAIRIEDATVTDGIINRGTLSTTDSYSAVLLTNADVSGGITNEVGASIYSNGYYALQIGSGSDVTGDIHNKGSLTGEVGLKISASELTGDIINEGTIDGAEGAVEISGSTVTGDITNYDRIVSDDSIGFYLYDSLVGGHITNLGYIGGDSYSIYTTDLTQRVAIDNYGELDGAVFINDSTLNLEDGTILTDAIDGNNGIVNIKTEFSTGSDFGQYESLNEINIRLGKSLSALGNNSFGASEFSNEGTLSVLEGNTVAINGNYYQSPDGTLRLQANSISNYAQLNINGDATFENSNIFVDVTSGASFANNDVLDTVIYASGTLDAVDLIIADNSSLFNFSTLVSSHGVDLIVAADSDTSVEESVSNQNNNPGQGAAKVLDQIIGNSPTGDMAVIRDALGTLTNEEEVSKAVSQTLPTLTGGSTTAMMQTMSTTGQVVQARQDQNLGLSSGDEIEFGRSTWFKPFGSWANQGTKDGVVGFGADTYGLVAGADRVVGEAWRLGGAFTYANTSVKSDDSLNKLDVDTYLATAYSSYTVDPQTEANFQLSLGYNNNDSSRIINFGGLNRVASGEFDSYSFNAGAGIGRRFDIGANTSFVPSARFDYNLMYNDSYMETGAGGLNLNVKSQTADQLIPAVQAKINYDFANDYVVSANAGVGYDLLNETNSVTSSYVGGGSAFVTNGLRSSPWIVRTGLGLTYKTAEAYDFTVRYDREDRGSEFDNQSVTAKMRMPF